MCMLHIYFNQNYNYYVRFDELMILKSIYFVSQKSYNKIQKFQYWFKSLIISIAISLINSFVNDKW